MVKMSDMEDDFMCDDEEDYDLVCLVSCIPDITRRVAMLPCMQKLHCKSFFCRMLSVSWPGLQPQLCFEAVDGSLARYAKYLANVARS